MLTSPRQVALEGRSGVVGQTNIRAQALGRPWMLREQVPQPLPPGSLPSVSSATAGDCPGLFRVQNNLATILLFQPWPEAPRTAPHPAASSLGGDEPRKGSSATSHLHTPLICRDAAHGDAGSDHLGASRAGRASGCCGEQGAPQAILRGLPSSSSP